VFENGLNQQNVSHVGVQKDWQKAESRPYVYSQAMYLQEKMTAHSRIVMR
jgi:hypothetical protein